MGGRLKMPTSVESLDASGYLNGRYAEEGMDEDGFFTCAVSVQHKVTYFLKNFWII